MTSETTFAHHDQPDALRRCQDSEGQPYMEEVYFMEPPCLPGHTEHHYTESTTNTLTRHCVVHEITCRTCEHCGLRCIWNKTGGTRTTEYLRRRAER